MHDTKNSIEKKEKILGVFCHLGAFAGYLFPFGNIIAPLIVWLLNKDESPFVDDQGTESLNFQISITIYMVVAGLLCFIFVGIPILIGLVIFDLIVVIKAAIKANQGECYRYPLTIRFKKLDDDDNDKLNRCLPRNWGFV